MSTKKPKTEETEVQAAQRRHDLLDQWSFVTKNAMQALHAWIDFINKHENDPDFGDRLDNGLFITVNNQWDLEITKTSKMPNEVQVAVKAVLDAPIKTKRKPAIKVPKKESK